MRSISCQVPRFPQPWRQGTLTVCLALGFLMSGFSATKPIVTFDAPGAGTNTFQGTLPVMVSDSGEVIGYYADANYVFHGFIRFADGTFTNIDAPGVGTTALQGTLPSGIDDDGAIVGFFYDSNTVLHGFLRDPSGTFVTVDAPLAGTGSDQGTDVTSINLHGEIAGYVLDNNNVYHGWLRSPSGKFTVFDVPGAGTGNKQGTIVLYGGALNHDGEICGFYVDPTGAVLSYVRQQTGVITTFDPLDSTLCFPDWINNEGVATGLALTNGTSRGFIRSAEGVITIIGAPFGTLGAFGTQPNAISSRGVITGFFGDTNNICHGFVRSQDGKYHEFDAPGAGAVPGSGQGTTPLSINSEGEIVGYLEDSDDVVHGFVRGG